MEELTANVENERECYRLKLTFNGVVAEAEARQQHSLRTDPSGKNQATLSFFTHCGGVSGCRGLGGSLSSSSLCMCKTYM